MEEIEMYHKKFWKFRHKRISIFFNELNLLENVYVSYVFYIFLNKRLMQ